MFTRIRADIQAALQRDPAARSRLEVLLCYPGLHAIIWHRVAHWLWSHQLKLTARFVSQVNRLITGIEIHPGARIGQGLLIDHGMATVIGETAEIGDNCTLYQGVTLGGTSQQRVKRHPTLGNNVVVGAGARLIGAITIGDNVKVGAGSVVVTSVPPNATVIGVPGRVVAIRNPDTDTIEHLPDPEGDLLECLQCRLAELERRLCALEEALKPQKVAAAKNPGQEGG